MVDGYTGLKMVFSDILPIAAVDYIWALLISKPSERVEELHFNTADLPTNF